VLQINHASRYLLYHKWTDMRKSFDGLCGLVTNELNMAIKLGDIFIFFNKRQTHVKLLQWEGDGFSLYYKRLESGTFEMPGCMQAGTHSVISSRQLVLVLQGISLKKAHYRKRYISTGSA
jgi:transposase